MHNAASSQTSVRYSMTQDEKYHTNERSVVIIYHEVPLIDKWSVHLFQASHQRLKSHDCN